MVKIEKAYTVCEMTFGGLETLYVNQAAAIAVASNIIKAAHPSWYDAQEIHSRDTEAMIENWNKGHLSLQFFFRKKEVKKVVGITEKGDL